MPLIRVSAGIITCGSQLLICQRRGQDLHALKWEFPGGKATDVEDDTACLHRELSEELRINATIGEQLHQTTHHGIDLLSRSQIHGRDSEHTVPFPCLGRTDAVAEIRLSRRGSRLRRSSCPWRLVFFVFPQALIFTTRQQLFVHNL